MMEFSYEGSKISIHIKGEFIGYVEALKVTRDVPIVTRNLPEHLMPIKVDVSQFVRKAEDE